MGLQTPGSKNLPGRPVPGGKSQAGEKRTPLPSYSSGGARVGKGRGIIGGGTADIRGRTPAEQRPNAPGNYGGGFAGVRRTNLPPRAPRKG